jgi:flagellin
LNNKFEFKLYKSGVRTMSVINTNMSALVATNAIIANDRNQEIAMERLSTGLRINSASDDAAGLAISSRMEAEVSGLNMATRNANDAISMIETLEGSSREIGAALQRMRELTVQAASDTYGVTDRAALDLEFGQLMSEMERIASQTTWNEITVMNGANTAAGVPLRTAAVGMTTLTIQLGKAAGQSMALSIKSFDPQSAVRAATRLEVVNPVTGATITRAAAPPIVENNIADANGVSTSGSANHGGLDRSTALLGGSMTAAQITAAQSGGLTLAGNDNHVRVTPGTANRRDAETQAYGSAVLYVGFNNNSGDADGGLGDAQVTATGHAAPAEPGPLGLQRINILSRINANYALENLDIAISAVSAERAKYGAYIARFEHAGDNLTNVARHQEQSRSRIADADYAIETSELSRTTIIAQASTAMLAQANAAKQTVLTLLQ